MSGDLFTTNEDSLVASGQYLYYEEVRNIIHLRKLNTICR